MDKIALVASSAGSSASSDSVMGVPDDQLKSSHSSSAEDRDQIFFDIDDEEER